MDMQLDLTTTKLAPLGTTRGAQPPLARRLAVAAHTPQSDPAAIIATHDSILRKAMTLAL